jgi:hypothetical protein
LVSFGVVDEVAEDFFATGECIFHESLTVDKQNEVMRILPDFTTPALRGVEHGVFTWVMASPFDFCGCHFFVGFAFAYVNRDTLWIDFRQQLFSIFFHFPLFYKERKCRIKRRS